MKKFLHSLVILILVFLFFGDIILNWFGINDSSPILIQRKELVTFLSDVGVYIYNHPYIQNIINEFLEWLKSTQLGG